MSAYNDGPQEFNRQRQGTVAATELNFDRTFSRDNLFLTFEKIRMTSRGAGADGVSFSQMSLAEGAENCGRLERLIAEGKYRPGRVRRVEAAKPKGGVRILSLACIMDRVVARAAHEALQPFAEKIFLEPIFGFRPERTRWQMLGQVVQNLEKGRGWFGAYDVVRAFDELPIDAALASVSRLFDEMPPGTVSGRARWIEAIGTIVTGECPARPIGINQGNSLSPLILNLAFHFSVDRDLARTAKHWWRWADNFYVVSADRRLISLTRSATKISLAKLGMRIRGKRGNVAAGDTMSVLGLDLRNVEGRVSATIAEDAWGRLCFKLARVGRRSGAEDRVSAILCGWIEAHGPALRNPEDVLARAKSLALELTGIAPVCDRLAAAASRAWRTWEHLLRRLADHRPSNRPEQVKEETSDRSSADEADKCF